jgi:vacuolar-type H+-ATPase subunit F/Vma7
VVISASSSAESITKERAISIVLVTEASTKQLSDKSNTMSSADIITVLASSYENITEAQQITNVVVALASMKWLGENR